MSAVEELRKYDTYDVEFGKLVDAAIAALEAENERLTALRESDQAIAAAECDRLRVELAALKGRRCETCRWQEKGAMDPDSCAVLQGFIPCKDFGCNQWEARP